MSRLIAVFLILVCLILVITGNALADLSLANIICGTYAGYGPEIVQLYTVPDGFRFVLTDFSWSAISERSFTITIRDQSSDKWTWCAWSPNVLNIDAHWVTGLVYEPNTTVELDVTHQISTDNWRASWSGYLQSTIPADVGESINPLPDQQILTSPNPSGDLSNLEFSLGQSDHVIVAVFDVQGRKVRTLHEGQLPQGIYSMPWDGMDDQGNSVSDGIYFARVETAEKTSVSKLTRVQ